MAQYLITVSSRADLDAAMPNLRIAAPQIGSQIRNDIYPCYQRWLCRRGLPQRGPALAIAARQRSSEPSVL